MSISMSKSRGDTTPHAYIQQLYRSCTVQYFLLWHPTPLVQPEKVAKRGGDAAPHRTPKDVIATWHIHRDHLKGDKSSENERRAPITRFKREENGAHLGGESCQLGTQLTRVWYGSNGRDKLGRSSAERVQYNTIVRLNKAT
jgi:hypothetical protein